jgi:hypothetical protein
MKKRFLKELSTDCPQESFKTLLAMELITTRPPSKILTTANKFLIKKFI